MAAKPSKSRSVVGAAKAVPWAIVIATTAEVAKAAKEHWSELPPRDRKRLQELLAKSKGRPDKLTQSERDELVGLARRIDAVGFAKRVTPLLGAAALRRGMRR
jgi:hypothetical protein